MVINKEKTENAMHFPHPQHH